MAGVFSPLPFTFGGSFHRNRQTIGRRFIEIAPASRADYYEAIANVSFDVNVVFAPCSVAAFFFSHCDAPLYYLSQQHLQEQEGTGRLSSGGASGDEGLGEEGQSGEMASEVSGLLWGHSSSSPPMHGVSGQPGYGEGMGLAGAPPGVGMGGRGVADPGGMHAPLAKRTGGGIQVGEHTGFLRMRGLPFSAAKDDIYKFFVGYNPIQESIVLTYRNDGRATGEAYVGFASPEDAKRGMDLHRKSMGSRYIELFISNKDEQGRALARFGNR